MPDFKKALRNDSRLILGASKSLFRLCDTDMVQFLKQSLFNLNDCTPKNGAEALCNIGDPCAAISELKLILKRSHSELRSWLALHISLLSNYEMNAKRWILKEALDDLDITTQQLAAIGFYNDPHNNPGSTFEKVKRYMV